MSLNCFSENLSTDRNTSNIFICRHLNQMQSTVVYLGDSSRQTFAERFGPKLKTIATTIKREEDVQHLELVFRLCPKIENLLINYSSLWLDLIDPKVYLNL